MTVVSDHITLTEKIYEATYLRLLKIHGPRLEAMLDPLIEEMTLMKKNLGYQTYSMAAQIIYEKMNRNSEIQRKCHAAIWLIGLRASEASQARVE